MFYFHTKFPSKWFIYANDISKFKSCRLCEWRSCYRLLLPHIWPHSISLHTIRLTWNIQMSTKILLAQFYVHLLQLIACCILFDLGVPALMRWKDRLCKFSYLPSKLRIDPKILFKKFLTLVILFWLQTCLVLARRIKVWYGYDLFKPRYAGSTC